MGRYLRRQRANHKAERGKFTYTPINVRAVGGAVELPALVTESGMFAVHRTTLGGEQEYTVTHVMSGMAIRNGLSKNAAMALASYLEQRKEHWKFRSPKKIPAATHIDLSNWSNHED